MITAEEVRKAMLGDMNKVMKSIELKIQERANGGFTDMKYTFYANKVMVDEVIFKLTEAGFSCVRTDDDVHGPAIYIDWEG